jgi:hypothetical protein
MPIRIPSFYPAGNALEIVCGVETYPGTITRKLKGAVEDLIYPVLPILQTYTCILRNGGSSIKNKT